MEKEVKKTILYTTFLMAIICAACNFPIASQEIPVDDLASAVASTLTALPTFTITPDIPVTRPAGESSLATIFPIMADKLTMTPSPTIINTATPTQTSTPEDPRQSLGDPAWKSNLDTGKAFGLNGNYQDDSGNAINISNSMMIMTNPNTNGYLMWRLTVASPGDAYIEAGFKSQNCSGSDQFGIAFRAPDYSNGFGYYFGITCDGNYNLYRRDEDAGKTILFPLTPSVNLRSGSGQTNILGVLTKGNNIKLFANGKLLQEINDSKFTLGGHFGPFIMGYSGNNVIGLDNIAYWILP
jgi:hypothetical protein